MKELPKFNNQKLLEQAFVHRSYLNEVAAKSGISHNERLEFLGDAVLELIVTEYLYKNYPDSMEGELTAYRSGLVNANTLAKVATDLRINDNLKLSRGESKDTNSKARLNILADAYEAILGALYLDQGYSACEEFVTNTLVPELVEIIKYGKHKDAKSMIQEKAQFKLGCTPTYKVLREEGPDHNKKFIIGIYFDNVLISEGEGNSKQEAEISAAQNALKLKGWIQ
jgi:ribonuclease-3